MTTTPKFEVAVHMPDDVPNQVVKCTSIKNAISTNGYYPTPVPTAAIFKVNIENASDAEAATKTNPPTVTFAFRDEKVNTMLTNVESYRLACQALVNAAQTETLAQQIAVSFDMELKTHTAHGPRQDEILAGPVPSSALYRMYGTGPHQLEISFDNGVTSKQLDPTGKGEAVIPELPLNTFFWLRNRQILTNGKYSDWTSWKKFSINK